MANKIAIIQGTTPTLTFNLPIPTSTLISIEMTISSRGGKELIKKTSATYQDMSATISLSQEETFDLLPDLYNVQLRIKTTSNKIYATPFFSLEVLPLVSKVQI